MQLTHNLEQVNLDKPSVTTVGVFDGVHVGHQYLIKALVEAAHANERAAVVISFFPHPDRVLRGVTGRYYLTTPEEKAAIMQDLGVDVLILHPFDDSVRQIRAADFVDKLVKYVNLNEFWATADFAMGYQREGNIQFLTEQGQRKGFTVQTIDQIMGSQARISSSTIRAALAAGDIHAANEYLGRPYRVMGEVVHGDQRGRTIGFPTANIGLWEEKIIPANGVYACHAFLGDERLNAVTNVGQRPTFDGQSITVEAHILDFDREIYGKVMALDFLHRLRGEQKFDGIDALVAQIGADRDTARELLAE